MPCMIQCTFYCHRVDKIIAPLFCICRTPILRLKMTATDPAFRWCRLLLLVLWFSQRKCGVCPKTRPGDLVMLDPFGWLFIQNLDYFRPYKNQALNYPAMNCFGLFVTTGAINLVCLLDMTCGMFLHLSSGVPHWLQCSPCMFLNSSLYTFLVRLFHINFSFGLWM